MDQILGACLGDYLGKSWGEVWPSPGGHSGDMLGRLPAGNLGKPSKGAGKFWQDVGGGFGTQTQTQASFA